MYVRAVKLVFFMCITYRNPLLSVFAMHKIKMYSFYACIIFLLHKRPKTSLKAIKLPKLTTFPQLHIYSIYIFMS